MRRTPLTTTPRFRTLHSGPARVRYSQPYSLGGSSDATCGYQSSIATWVGVVRRMNQVTLRQARLVLGWVTVFARVYHLGM